MLSNIFITAIQINTEAKYKDSKSINNKSTIFVVC